MRPTIVERSPTAGYGSEGSEAGGYPDRLGECSGAAVWWPGDDRRLSGRLRRSFNGKWTPNRAVGCGDDEALGREAVTTTTGVGRRWPLGHRRHVGDWTPGTWATVTAARSALGGRRIAVVPLAGNESAVPGEQGAPAGQGRPLANGDDPPIRTRPRTRTGLRARSAQDLRVAAAGRRSRAAARAVRRPSPARCAAAPTGPTVGSDPPAALDAAACRRAIFTALLCH